MAATAPFNAPILGSEGDTCRGCANPLATDQRYCLECGARRGDTRVPFGGPPAPPAAPDPSSPTAAIPAPARGSEWTPLTAIGLVAVIALILLAGILVGQGLGGDGDARVVTVGGSGGTGASGTASGAETAAFESDWPSGTDGWTVELGSIDKGGATAADVQSAKDDATGKGAADVGALDSDDYPSLPGGSYVVYSGVYDTKAEAAKALAKLEGDFPDAKVVKVSTQATAAAGSGGGGGTGGAAQVGSQDLKNLDEATGDDYVEKSKKLPDDTAVQGKPPPKDNKAPGGGSGAIDIN
jgi:SPOR domain